MIKNFLNVFFIGLFISGCVSITPAPDDKETKPLPQYWLTTSLYVGPFYDDDKVKLVDYRPFSALDDVQTLDGITVSPKSTEATIPAGSLVTIMSIDYPDEKTRMKRPIFSPRDHIWVSLKIGRERGRVTVFREKPHILVVPRMIETEEQLHGFLKRFLSNKDPNRWLLQQESYFQNGIFEKRPVVGMKRQHLVAALGPALKKQFQKASNFEEAKEIWHYHDYLIIIEDDAVTKISKIGKSS